MKSVVLTTEYLGPISSYYCKNRCEAVMVEHHENYQKKSYRNRCRIATANGLALLSVPLQGGKSSQCPIAEVAVAYDTDWPTEHLQALTAAYSSSPYFEYYIPEMAAILQRKHTSLLSLNNALQAFVLKAWQLDVKIKPTTNYNRDYSEDVIDLRKYHYTNSTPELGALRPSENVHAPLKTTPY